MAAAAAGPAPAVLAAVALLAATATSPQAVPPLTCTPNLDPGASVFAAAAWSSTCECVDAVAPGKPCNTSAKDSFVCETFENIVPLAQLGCSLHADGCRRGEFGTQADWAVGCALHGNNQSGGFSKATSRCPGWAAQPGTAQQPAGRAYLQLANANLLLGTGVTPNPEPLSSDNILANESSCGVPFSGLWADHALAALRTQSQLFFAAYKAANGSVDELVLDWEGQFLYFPGGLRAGSSKQGGAPEPCPGPGGTNASNTCVRCAAARWHAIQADPRWPKALTELHSLGFVMSSDEDLATVMKPCIGWDSLCTRSQRQEEHQQQERYDRNRMAMGAYVTELEARFWQQALETPARAYYPNVRMSMYSYARWSPEHCLAPTSPEGWVACLTGKGAAGASVDAPELKGLSFPSLIEAQHKPYVAPGVGSALDSLFGLNPQTNPFSNATFEDEAFLTIKLQLGMMKNAMLASLPGGQLPGRFQENTSAPVVAPWVDWADCAVAPSGERLPPTAYWQEKLLHLALAGADHFYYYNVWSEHQGCQHTTMASNRLLSAVLKELDHLVGCGPTDRQWITDTDVRWQDDFILTGMDVGADRRAWRLTPQLQRGAASWNESKLRVQVDPASGMLTVSPLGFALPRPQVEASLDPTASSTAAGGKYSSVVASCELRVPWGELLHIDSGDANDAAASVAPLGLWILQSRPPLPVSIDCGSAGVFPWPVQAKATSS